MAYKKYIERNGKRYGPYIYHSRRVGGKVISEYHGTKTETKYKKFIFIFLGVLFLVGIGYGIVSNNLGLTGRATDVGAEIIPGINNLTVTQILEENESQEGNNSIHKYELGLDVFGLEDLSANYSWNVDCGEFVVDNAGVGTKYSGINEMIEWHTIGECKDAVVDVNVLVDGRGQELVQPVFNSEEVLITNLRIELSAENVTESEVEEAELESIEDPVAPEEVGEPEIVLEDVEILPFLISEEERQILIAEFGTNIVESEARLVNGRTIIKYRLGNMWIENSYDSDLEVGELAKQMEKGRTKWLQDIINEISEEPGEEELEVFAENVSF
jgi:hypothetical protein